MKTMANFNRQYLQVNILKTIAKYTAKKQDTKNIPAVATLTNKLIFLTLASKNIIKL